jgi:hypothetical protein
VIRSTGARRARAQRCKTWFAGGQMTSPPAGRAPRYALLGHGRPLDSLTAFVRQQSRWRVTTGPRSWPLSVGSSSDMQDPERVLGVHRDRPGGRAGTTALVATQSPGRQRSRDRSPVEGLAAARAAPRWKRSRGQGATGLCAAGMDDEWITRRRSRPPPRRGPDGCLCIKEAGRPQRDG